MDTVEPAQPTKLVTEEVSPTAEDLTIGKDTAVAQDSPSSSPAQVAKSTRKRSGALVIDDVITPAPPKGEPYPRQVRISEVHHKLLRKLAFNHDVTMNHVLYNLLDLLVQADQRDQQNHA